MTGQSSANVNLSAIKARQQQGWAAGDITITVRPLVGVAENLCEAIELHAGQKVLDIGTCTGNVALAAARRYCDVTGIDYVPSLLEVARARAAVERLSITFLEGDAENLPFSSASFDVVLSALGVMFAPDQERAANELLRICRPGGKIGLVNWTPEGFFGAISRVMGAYVPPPAGVKSSALWGTQAYLQKLFGEEVTFLQVAKRTFFHRYRSSQHAMEETCRDFGPAVTVLQALEPAVRAHLSHDILTLFEQANQADDGTILVPAEYLEVVAVRR